MGKRKSILRKAAPLCLAAVLASTGTLAVTQPDMAHILSSAGLFGDIDGDGSVGASDAAEILMYAAWSGAGNTGDLAYFEQLSGNAVTETTEAPAENTEAPAETTEAPSETTEAPAETTEAPAETTEPAAEDNYDYGFYDVLSAEWAKTGDTSTYIMIPAEGSGSGNNAVMQNGKIMFYHTVSSATTLYSYDITTKEVKSAAITQDDSLRVKQVFYSNGYTYVMTYTRGNDPKYALIKYDQDCNVVCTNPSITNYIISNQSNIEISESGYILLPNNNNKVYLTPELEVKTLPDLVVKDSHGLETTITELECIGSYGDSFYVEGQNSVDSTWALYRFNAATEEWTTVLENTCVAGSSSGHPVKCIGRYLLFVNAVNIKETPYSTIFDMETNTVYADDIPKESKYFAFHEFYYGGKRLIIASDTSGEIRAFTPARATAAAENPANAFKAAELLCTDSTSDGSGITLLDDTYYIHRDSAGLFLRKYETGAEQEETVFLFPQS